MQDSRSSHIHWEGVRENPRAEFPESQVLNPVLSLNWLVELAFARFGGNVIMLKSRSSGFGDGCIIGRNSA
jgi:hypothetical protein